MSDRSRSLGVVARASDRLCHILWLFQRQEPEIVELTERHQSVGYPHYFASRLGVLEPDRWVPAVRTMPASLVEHVRPRCLSLQPREYALESVQAAGAALRRLRPDEPPVALRELAEAARVNGELAGAWAAVERPADPYAAAIRDAMVLREERAHRHYAAAADSGLDDLELILLTVRWRGGDPRRLGRAFRWPDAEVEAAVSHLRELGLLGAGEELTADGQRMREELEAATDLGMAEAMAGVEDLPAAANSLGPLTEI